MLLVLPGLQELIEFPEHPVAFRAPGILRLRKAHKALRATISFKYPMVSRALRALGALSHPTNKSAPSAQRAIRTSMAPKASKAPRVSRAFKNPEAPGLKVIPGLPGN